MENFRTIGAYWYSRPEPLKQCTQRLLRFLVNLKEHNPSYFSTWYETGMNKNEALKYKVDLSYLYLQRLLSKKNKEDGYPNTSFRAAFWNGSQNEVDVISISVALGSNESVNFTNNCIIKLPFNSFKNEFYNNSTVNQHSLLEVLQSSWKPEWVSINGNRI